jgi:hypothetical protein
MLPETKPAPPPPPPAKQSRARLIAGVLALLAVAFAAGYVPQMLAVRRLETSLATTRLDLRLSELHRIAGVASHEAQRNNYANAAAAASEFFHGCRVLAQSEPFTNRPRTKLAITAYAASEREIAPMLATADPQAKERLANLYLTMDGVLKRRE